MLTSNPLTQQTALITGASSASLGKAAGAGCFAQAGARLILAARRKAKLQSMADDLQRTEQPMSTSAKSI